MGLTGLDNDITVKIDYIFLLRRLIEAEETMNFDLQEAINSLLYSIMEYAEEHKCMPYGPTIKIGYAKELFPSYKDTCPIIN